MSTARILVVDDEADIRDLVREILTEEGYAVDVAANAAEARAAPTGQARASNSTASITARPPARQACAAPRGGEHQGGREEGKDKRGRQTAARPCASGLIGRSAAESADPPAAGGTTAGCSVLSRSVCRSAQRAKVDRPVIGGSNIDRPAVSVERSRAGRRVGIIMTVCVEVRSAGDVHRTAAARTEDRPLLPHPGQR